ncbi:MAG: hypothetical protein JXQ75_12840 [Phycisphaerae bacterium]|nr:hypothetical protein [Phycisphaerae bacterium]
METKNQHDDRLPVLRPDIEFYAGPEESDGSPTYIIHDPLQGSYEKATWIQARILTLLRTHMTMRRLMELLAFDSTIRIHEEEVRRLCNNATSKGLTKGAAIGDERALLTVQERPSGNLFETLLRRSIYFRIPLICPDAFLGRTVGLMRYLASPAALTVYFVVSAIGVVLLTQRFDAYMSTFLYFFNIQGVLSFAATISAVKVIHEFSYAYVAKAMGIRVSTIGVALILLFPVAYSDVTDSWRLSSRRKRLRISLAGVIAELVIAGLASFMWAISSPGVLKSLCFVLSSATLTSTLLVNLNPAMRFDG